MFDVLSFVCVWGIYFLLFTAVDGVWTDWGHWNQCDVSCGSGTSTRTRSCTNPPPAHGGDDCQGPSQETSTCTLTNCPGNGRLNWEHVYLKNIYDQYQTSDITVLHSGGRKLVGGWISYSTNYYTHND